MDMMGLNLEVERLVGLNYRLLNLKWVLGVLFKKGVVDVEKKS